LEPEGLIVNSRGWSATPAGCSDTPGKRRPTRDPTPKGSSKRPVARYVASPEQRDVFEEDVYFAPPAGLRRQMQAQGIDPATRRIHVSKPEITPEAYGAVPLTISAARGE
jgi:hypothetical protein